MCVIYGHKKGQNPVGRRTCERGVSCVGGGFSSGMGGGTYQEGNMISHGIPVGNGSCSSFSPSLKGRSARQTASTRVGELCIRYMGPLQTSLTDLYSYGTTVHICRFFPARSLMVMRRVQIMPTSRLARATGSHCHHAHSTDPCRARGVGNGQASNHANPICVYTARMCEPLEVGLPVKSTAAKRRGHFRCYVHATAAPPSAMPLRLWGAAEGAQTSVLRG